MLSKIGLILDKKEENNDNNKSIINKEKNKFNYELMGRDNKTILENIQYQMIHQSKNNDKNKINEIICDEIKIKVISIVFLIQRKIKELYICIKFMQ